MRTASNVLRAGRIAPWTRSPLMRAADRCEQTLRLLMVFAAAAAIALAVLVAMTQYRSSETSIHAANATKTPVTAVITGDPVRIPAPTTMFADQLRAPAQWVRGTQPGDGMVDVDGTVHRGDHIHLWLDGRGEPTTPPLSDDVAVTKGVATGMAALLGCWAAAYALPRITGYALDRRRAAQWAREWRWLGPNVGQDRS